MDTTTLIIVLVVVLVVAALVAWLIMQQRKKKQHEHAEQLRTEAREHAQEIPETQVRAKEAEAEAERARLEAEHAQARAREAQVAATQQQAVHEDRLRTADQVDPHVDTSSDDYAPGTTTGEGSSATHDPDTVLDADDPRRTDGTGGTHRA
jgi:predicted negative regulator of RcsB-dependent stress response